MTDTAEEPVQPAPAVHKYTFEIVDGLFDIEMRRDAHILHVAHQPSTGQFCVWAAVDTNLPMVKRKFFVVGTGHPLPTDRAIAPVGTVIDGSFVWHLWEDHTEAMIKQRELQEAALRRAQILGGLEGTPSPGKARIAG